MVFNQSEYYKKWRLANKEKMAEYMRQYRKDHPEYVEEANRQDREKRKMEAPK